MITISSIESAILARLQSKWAVSGGSQPVSEFDIGNDFNNILATPAVSIATERIGTKRITDTDYTMTPQCTLYMAFKNVAGPAGRRSGIYPIVQGVFQILIGKACGLDIKPLQPVGPINEVFHPNLKANGLIGFKMVFETSFDVDILDDEPDAVQLVSIGASYYLQPDDHVAEVTDIITIEQEPLS